MDRSVLDSLLDKLVDETFLGFIDNFTSMYCQLWGESGAEFTLKQTEVHEQYQRLYESRIETHLKQAGVTFPAFVAACAELQKEDETFEIFLDSLTAVSDFEAFSAMMRAKRPPGVAG